MNDWIKKIVRFLCCFIMLMVVMATQTNADVLPTPYDNLSVGLRSFSNLVATKDGYMRVFYDNKKINIEYYDNKFNITKKKSIAMELPVWGGFYAGDNDYYVVEGKHNTAQKNDAEVVRVIKYNKNWKKIGAAKITGNTKLFGGEVGYIFDVGCVEMTEYNGNLYIVTAHDGYVDSQYGQGHQGFLMIKVNQKNMKGEIVLSDLWHSFAQYIKNKGSVLYVLEQSEGDRCTQLSKIDANNLKKQSIEVLGYGGLHTSAWAIPCYASVDGMALSKDNVLCLGTSIDQSKYDKIKSDTPHNIYITVTPTSNFSEKSTKVKWITKYKGGGKSFLGTKITRVNDNRFMVSWEEYDTSQKASNYDTLSTSILHYVFIDGKGNVISKEYKAAAPISECQPIVKNSNIVFYASNANMVNFYSINAKTGKFKKKMHRVLGGNATWNLSKGVLTITGKGAISIQKKDRERLPKSSASGWFVTYEKGNWDDISKYIKKIVIKKGITSIPNEAFAHLDNLEEVNIADGLKSIGKKSFYACNSIKKIYLPSSVNKIGADILWTGYYWTYDRSHVTSGTIYAPYNSYAIKYAKKNNISYKKYIPKVVISKLVSNKSKKLVVKWEKVTQADGYQIQYARNSKFTSGAKSITVAKKTTVSKSVTRLVKNKNYYVRVRAYKKINGKKRYGHWSTTKKCKVK